MNETKATKGGLWYFAHPYTCKDKDGNYIPEGEEANFRICNMRAAEMLDRGYNVYSPISHTHPIYRASPAMLARQEHELWYHLDNEIIDSIKWAGIILSPGWEKSTGCCAEKKRIEAQGGFVLYYEDIMKGNVKNE